MFLFQAKLNVLRGNYPMDVATLVKLAGIQAAAKSYPNKELWVCTYVNIKLFLSIKTLEAIVVCAISFWHL